MRDVGDPEPESEETLRAAPPNRAPAREGRHLGEALPARGSGAGLGPRAVAAGLRGAGGQWGEELREPAVHLCAARGRCVPGRPSLRVRPDSSPAWEPEHGGRTRPGRGARERKAASAGVPSPRPAD